MNDELFECTKLAAYFLWENTGCDNALSLWYCAEDIACYFERNDICNPMRVAAIKTKGVDNAAYIGFVRQVAYRVYIYTRRDDALANWFAAERLLATDEWLAGITQMADVYRREKNNRLVMDDVRSENVRAYYEKQTFNRL